jgi:NTE family protein
MRNIGLALQGGGAYAAFTTGVLKTMFDPRKGFLKPRAIHSVTGTSGGALNAMLLGQAIHENHKNPTAYVSRLWEINRLERLLREELGIPETIPDEFLALLIGMSRSVNASNPLMASALSEYSKKSSKANELLNDMVYLAAPTLPQDIDAPLFPNKKPFITVAGTEVKSGQAHYFSNNGEMIEQFQKLNISRNYSLLKELTLRGVYASLAHPNLFKSVEIDQNLYWDGYYTSNPPFFYMFREGCDEIFLIRLIQRNREDIGEDLSSVEDRAEEIIQNTALNMEIQMYLLMREILFKNKKLKGLALKLGSSKFTRASVYHEIRLLKPGNIADEGYPVAGFVDKLLQMGRKVMTAKKGFIKAYQDRGKNKTLQIISEIGFETGKVNSYTIDTDDFILGERKYPSGTPTSGSTRAIIANIKRKLLEF